jgi:two-component system, sensor histidine kinase and response regulator
MPRRHRILAVDDSPVNLAILEEMLADSYELRCAGSGEEALTVAREFRPDIVLLDIMMPGMGGFEACECLRRDSVLSHAKVILLSAKTEVANRLKGYEVGADDFISKPFNHEELLAKIAVFLRLKNAEELDALKSDVLMLINHETRTPLNGILGALQLLADSESCAAASEQELIQYAVHSGQRLERLIRKGMLYAELRSGRVTFTPLTICLRTMLEDVIGSQIPQAISRGVTVELRGIPSAMVAADATHLRFVCESLLENAIRFTAPTVPVVVNLACVGDMVELSVADGGRGVDASYLPHLFDGFVSTDIAHHTEGHGLSLAICKEILERHGGSIAVESIAGEGATFRAVMPASPVRRELTNTGPSPTPAAACPAR